MNLSAHQRILLGLFRSAYQVGAADESYFHSVAQSRALEEAQRNIFLWRVFVLERTCALTTALLKQRGLFEQTLNKFIAEKNISPFRETQGPDFLESLREHPDHLVASVAQFELALIKVRQGDPLSHRISWAVEPAPILNNLAKNVSIGEDGIEGAYEITVSRALPSFFRIASNATE